MSDIKFLCQRSDDIRKTRATAFQNLTFSHSSSTGRLPRSSGLFNTKSHTATECKSWAPLHWPEGRLFRSFRCLNWVHWDLFFIHYFFLVRLGGTGNLLHVRHRDGSKTPSVREWIVSYRNRAAMISTSSRQADQWKGILWTTKCHNRWPIQAPAEELTRRCPRYLHRRRTAARQRRSSTIPLPFAHFLAHSHTPKVFFNHLSCSDHSSTGSQMPWWSRCLVPAASLHKHEHIDRKQSWGFI